MQYLTLKPSITMKPMLLPHHFRTFGWWLLIPTALLGILMWLDGFNGFPSYLLPADEGGVCYRTLTSETTTRLLNNVALIGILVGSLFVACSRERLEDELTTALRLDALLLALYLNTGLVIVAALCVYDLEFLNIMCYNLFTLPVLFLILFRWKIRRLRKEAQNEE